MKKIFKYGFGSLIILLLIGFAGIYFWSQQTYNASEELHQLVKDIPKEDEWLIFTPDEQPKAGIIIYPGAKVNTEAYSYIAQELQQEGYVVGIPTVTLNLSILNNNKADELINQMSGIDQWYIGGHSLGGVSAATYVEQHEESVAGLFFLASYPTSGTDFSATQLPMLSIYAENDGLSTLDKIDDSRSLFSDQATFHQIDGGNHAQFGMYGLQKGDNKATISEKEQQDEIADLLVEWLSQTSE